MKLGCMQTLRVIKKVDFGVYLADKDQAKAEERVLLPKKQVPDQTIIGDEIEVFLYRDSKDRIVAKSSYDKYCRKQSCPQIKMKSLFRRHHKYQTRQNKLYRIRYPIPIFYHSSLIPPM